MSQWFLPDAPCGTAIRLAAPVYTAEGPVPRAAAVPTLPVIGRPKSDREVDRPAMEDRKLWARPPTASDQGVPVVVPAMGPNLGTGDQEVLAQAIPWNEKTSAI